MMVSGLTPPDREEPDREKGPPDGSETDHEPPEPQTRPHGFRSHVRTSRRSWFFPVAVTLAVVVLGTLRLSGSSLSIYETGLGVPEGEAGVLAGPARNIRSDEWNVRTPWVLRQAELGFPERVTSGVGSHDVSVLADLPTRGWEGFLRPHTLSYRFLDASRAFALEWWTYYAVQLLGVYALLLALTRRPLLSALSASLVTLSPATQWWAAPATFTTVGYGSMAVALLLFALDASTLRRRVALAAAAGFVASVFVVTLYLPWLIGTALVLVPVGIGAIVSAVVRAAERRRIWRALATAGPIAAGVAVCLSGAFLLSHRETVATISATVYPGDQSVDQGGSARPVVLWGSAFDYFASQKPNAVVNESNQSENSSALVLLLPATLAFVGHRRAGKLRSHPSAYPLLGALLGGGLILAWMVLPVPGWIGQFALLTRVPPSRLFLPLGLASAVALALLVHYGWASGRKLRLVPVLMTVIPFASAQAWAAQAYTVDGRQIDLGPALLFVLVVSVGVALAIGRRPAIGLAVLAGFCLWQASFINPVQRGTDPLTDSPVRSAVDRLADGGRPGAGWVVFGGDSLLLGTLTAAGVNLLSAISPYPDVDAWRILDPDRRFEQVWNRYTRVSFVPGEAGSPVEVQLVQPDSIVVKVDTCSAALTELGVEVMVTRNFELARCALPLARLPDAEGYVMVYRRAA